jgi:hypothetical protein
MNPLVILSAVVAAAGAAPQYAVPVAAAGLHAAPLAYHAAPVALAHAAPVVVAHATPVAVPAPYTTSHVQGLPATTLHKEPAVVTKQLHYGSKDFVSGHTTYIAKPAIPDFRIAVPTALKGTHQVNPAIVTQVAEPYVVNEPFPVERRVEVPYDVPIVREQIVDVPVPYNVDRPYNVPVPTPVRGEDIINYRQGAPVIQRTHTNVHHGAVGYAHGGYAAAPLGYAQGAYANAPLGYAQGAYAAGPLGYAQGAYAAGPIEGAYAAAPIAATHQF